MTTQPDEPRGTTLAQYVKASPSDPHVAACAATAEELVKTYLRDVGDGSVPAVVRRAAVLEVGADLYHRRSARNGVATFGNDAAEITTARIRNDPLAAARPILAPYAGPGIA